MIEDDALVLMEDDAPELTGEPWHVLVVDDDLDVHAATALALNRFTYQDRPLRLSDAYSGKEALEKITAPNAVIDLVLLDVVMDTPTDGLDAARSIREVLNSLNMPYIIIRTGQPAYAAEADVMRMPQINAYLTKGKTTSGELVAAVREGLEAVASFINAGTPLAPIGGG
jgi:CheY-like chemotaxis protein